MNLPQGPEPDTAGYKGFFYHFLDIDTGRRVWNCELSTLDSAFLFAGALTCATYFDADTEEEAEVRRLADALYRRADWDWACNGGPTLTHGWKPETGFLPYRYEGYDEGLLLYLLALGSPTHPLPPESYNAYCATYRGKKMLPAASSSTPGRCSHTNFRTSGSISVAFATRSCASAPVTTSRTAGRRPLCSRSTQSGDRWTSRATESTVGAFTASDGPGWVKRAVNGVDREFYGYKARGAPFGPDDGTVSPWVEVASLPFAPEIVIPTVRQFARLDLGMTAPYGFKPSFNQTFAVEGSPTGWWVTPHHFGIDQGPVVLMIENYRLESDHGHHARLPSRDSAGLRRAGFTGGWL